MITGPLRSKIDKLWEEFWTGGITNPLTVIEQISFLMFARLLDAREVAEEKKHARLHKGQAFAGKYFDVDQQHVRWKNLKHEGDAAKVLELVRDELFPHMRSLGERGTTFGDLMKDAQLMIQKPGLLKSAIEKIDELPLLEGDTKGDLYEYLLSKLTTAGINGQFRTPRHIIRAMVELVEPRPDERICDPACGTAGFLVGAIEYLYEKYSSPEGVHEHEENGQVHKIYTGDLLDPYRDHIANGLLSGFEFDSTMLRIAAMNAMLHGVDTPNIRYQDTLSTSFTDRYPEGASDAFDLILANPPFKGSLDYEDVHSSLLGKVKTKKTELLFLVLMLRMLKLGGRAAVVVPDGVLFGSSKAHKSLRKMLVEENQLEAVISLPSGVFKPYAGVSTAILYFTKGGKTENVFFYDVQADGFSLDDKRDPVKEDDVPNMLARWEARDPKTDTDRTKKAFFVPVEDIRREKYDLSVGRYKEHVYEEVVYEEPSVILDRMVRLNSEIDDEIAALRGAAEMKPLGGQVDLLSGYAFSSRSYSANPDDLKLLRGANVSPGAIDWSDARYWPVDSVSESLERYRLRDGDIVIGMDRPWISSGFRLATIGPADLPALLVQRVARVRANRAIDQRYLAHLLSTPAFSAHLRRRHTETTVPHISSKDIASFLFKFPPLEEQRRIAAILDKADAIRRKRQAAIDLTDELLRSTFLHMFGDPVTNPKGWPDASLGELAELGSGVTKGRKLGGKQTVRVPYLRVANVQDGFFNLEEVKEIDVLPSDVEKCRLLPGDVLLTEGGDPDKLGRGAVWQGGITDCIHQNHVFRVRVDTDRVQPDFASALIGSQRGKRYFLRAAKQTTGIATINKRQLRGFSVLLPPLSLQQQYATRKARVGDLRATLEAAAASTDALFGSLVQRAFRGQLR